jgi:hypothetical protein
VLNDGQTVVVSHQNPHPLVLGAQPGKAVTGLPALLRAVGFGPGAAKPAVMLAMRTNAALRAQMASPQFPEANRIDGLVIHATTPGSQLAIGIDFHCRDAATAAAIDQRLRQLIAQGRAQAAAAAANPTGQLGAQLLGRVLVQTQGRLSRMKLTLNETEVATLSALLKGLAKKV